MSDQRDFLADSAARLFEAHADAAALAQRHGFQRSLWEQTEHLGITALLTAESAGGVGADWEDACAVLHVSGYWQTPLPLAETILARRLAAAAGMSCPTEPVSIAISREATLHVAEEGSRFTGLLPGVPWGRDVNVVFTTVTCDDQLHLVALNRSDAVMRPAVNLAGEPRDDLQFDAAFARVAPLDSHEAVHLLEYLALLRTAQVSGALESALHRTLTYARERKQFGRALGQFQAIQHQLATFGAEAAAVACAVRAAGRAACAGDASFQIAAAKLRTNQAIVVATAVAHQVHGAIGFTNEYPLRHATQRLWSWRSELGNDRFWGLRLGQVVVARGANDFWADLTARDDAWAIPT